MKHTFTRDDSDIGFCGDAYCRGTCGTRYWRCSCGWYYTGDKRNKTTEVAHVLEAEGLYDSRNC